LIDYLSFSISCATSEEHDLNNLTISGQLNSGDTFKKLDVKLISYKIEESIKGVFWILNAYQLVHALEAHIKKNPFKSNKLQFKQAGQSFLLISGLPPFLPVEDILNYLSSIIPYFRNVMRPTYIDCTYAVVEFDHFGDAEIAKEMIVNARSAKTVFGDHYSVEFADPFLDYVNIMNTIHTDWMNFRCNWRDSILLSNGESVFPLKWFESKQSVKISRNVTVVRMKDRIYEYFKPGSDSTRIEYSANWEQADEWTFRVGKNQLCINFSNQEDEGHNATQRRRNSELSRASARKQTITYLNPIAFVDHFISWEVQSYDNRDDSQTQSIKKTFVTDFTPKDQNNLLIYALNSLETEDIHEKAEYALEQLMKQRCEESKKKDKNLIQQQWKDELTTQRRPFNQFEHQTNRQENKNANKSRGQNAHTGTSRGRNLNKNQLRHHENSTNHRGRGNFSQNRERQSFPPDRRMMQIREKEIQSQRRRMPINNPGFEMQPPLQQRVPQGTINNLRPPNNPNLPELQDPTQTHHFSTFQNPEQTKK
jgi:hypothetical protein